MQVQRLDSLCPTEISVLTNFGIFAIFFFMEDGMEDVKFIFTKTTRGLRTIEFTDVYRIMCQIQESSSSGEHKIWVGQSPSRMHLSQRDITSILPILCYFLYTGNLPSDIYQANNPDISPANASQRDILFKKLFNLLGEIRKLEE